MTQADPTSAASWPSATPTNAARPIRFICIIRSPSIRVSSIAR